MGGGVGVSAHGNVRVVTEQSKIAMPEVGIGFIPDVGGTYMLSRAPGLLGLHAALTGAPFSGADAIALGFADHYVPHDELEAFTAAVVGRRGGGRGRAPTPRSRRRVSLLAQRDWIDECYAGETVADIVAALRGHDEGAANDAANLIATRSPIALSVALAAVRRAAELADPRRRAGPGVPGVVRLAALARSRRGHPRPDRRQGPQPEVVPAVAGRGDRARCCRTTSPRPIPT